jgi:hypothetical protein
MTSFKKAARTKAKARVALIGPSGSGKTFSALELATGLGGRIALIDTERGSGELYADKFEYDTLQLEPPFTPKKYIDAIRAAEEEGYNVVIIDSLSHAWAGEGGILDIHDSSTNASKSGNGFQTWKDVTPQHERIVNAILGAKLHVIGTIRTKTAYEIVENDRGKKEPKRIGLAPIQRAGLEYEFTCVLDLSVDSHIATASKDRTGLFDGNHFVIDRRIGQELAAWLDSGTEPLPVVDPLADWKEALKQCLTMDELAKLWAQLTPQQRVSLADLKDERKDELAEALAASRDQAPPAVDAAA